MKFCLRAPFSLGESRRKREGGRGGGGGGGLCGCPVCRPAPSFSFSFSTLGISPPPFLTFSSSSSSCSFLVSEIEFLPPGAIKRFLFPLFCLRRSAGGGGRKRSRKWKGERIRGEGCNDRHWTDEYPAKEEKEGSDKKFSLSEVGAGRGKSGARLFSGGCTTARETFFFSVRNASAPKLCTRDRADKTFLRDSFLRSLYPKCIFGVRRKISSVQ